MDMGMAQGVELISAASSFPGRWEQGERKTQVGSVSVILAREGKAERGRRGKEEGEGFAPQ